MSPSKQVVRRFLMFFIALGLTVSPYTMDFSDGGEKAAWAGKDKKKDKWKKSRDNDDGDSGKSGKKGKKNRKDRDADDDDGDSGKSGKSGKKGKKKRKDRDDDDRGRSEDHRKDDWGKKRGKGKGRNR